MGAFKGGEKFQAALEKIASELKEPGTLKVGFLAGATAPDGQSIPERAALNEFGHGNVPARPFFRNMIAEKSPGWAGGIAQHLKITNYNVEQTLVRTGKALSGQLSESILDLWSPPLSPKTIAKKGFEKPLIEHGDMINAVAYEVNGGSKVSPNQGKFSGSGAAKLKK